MSRVSTPSVNNRKVVSAIHLNLDVREPVVVGFLEPFTEPERSAKALEAIKIGVLSIRQGQLSLDTHVVESAFDSFVRELAEQFTNFLGERVGVLPKSLDKFFGENGVIATLFGKHFHPTDGRMAKLIDNQVGPNSRFARALDPKNKEGVVAIIEKTVRDMVENKLDEVLAELSLDEKDSALSRMKAVLAGGLAEIKQALGVEQGRKEEAARGTHKGLSFQEDLYGVVAELGRQLGDKTQFVANNADRNGKTGDHVITLGKASGAPDFKMVLEVKDREVSLKKATEELANAKENRGAAIGVFVWAKGCEPVEVGDFCMIDDDFFCTADKDDLDAGRRLMFLDAAYKVARMVAVLKVRKEASGTFDLSALQAHVAAVAKEVATLAQLAKKAATMKERAEDMEETLLQMHEQLGERLTRIRDLLDVETET